MQRLSRRGASAVLRVSAALYQRRCTSSQDPTQSDAIHKRIEQLEGAQANDALLRFYSNRRHSSFNMEEVVARCTDPRYDTAIFCHKELPVLLAHHVKAIDNLPCGLSAMASIQELRKATADWFHRLLHCPIPSTPATRCQYIEMVMSVDEERETLDILRKTATGVLELKEHLSRHLLARQMQRQQVDSAALHNRIFPEIEAMKEPIDLCNQYFIYYNFISRQLLNLQGQCDLKNCKRVGTVDRELDLVQCVRFAVEDAKQICSDVYGDCPDVKYELANDFHCTFPHQGSTIHYIVCEMMKNAFRATVDTHMKKNEMGIVTCADMPPVTVLVTTSASSSHACVCIADEGGGIPRGDLPKALSYTYTTASKPAVELLKESKQIVHKHSASDDGDDTTTNLAGYGFGLPMSRVYARAFGGDLQIQSMEGFGTKVFLFVRQGHAK